MARNSNSIETIQKNLDLAGQELRILHQISQSISSTLDLDQVLRQIVDLVIDVTHGDACLIYLLDEAGDNLILRASKNPHPRLIGKIAMRVGEGITGWVAREVQAVAIARHASKDPRFKVFHTLPEDRYEAFLSVPVLSRGKLVGVINLQDRRPHQHSQREQQIISMVGFLVGAEIELARLEAENTQLSERLEERKVVDRAKGILQRELGITEEEAYVTIQRQSRQRRKTKKEIAEAIVLGDELRRGKGGS